MIEVHDKIGIPKYQQIVFAVEKAIIRGKLKKGDQIPSINTIRDTNNLSRDTVLMAFNELRTRGIIQSVIGKGYYVTSEKISVKQKVLLLFDELNSFKEELYNAFINNLGNNIDVDIYFHNFNHNVFSTIIEHNIGNYSHYIVMPANLRGTEKVLRKLPDDRVYILDQMPTSLEKYPGIFQNFKNDIYNSLNSAKTQIKKYERLILVFSEDKQPIGMHDGFVSFCNDLGIPYDILQSLHDHTISKGNLYIIPDDKNLLEIIKMLRNTLLKLSDDIGIISYNDTLLKEVVEGGITTISTNFTHMGQRLAEMIQNKEKLHIENPNQLIIRNSL
ncbi:GntR family transcriptional regulator [Flavobacteriaceae bacterium MHTCC 0001]